MDDNQQHDTTFSENNETDNQKSILDSIHQRALTSFVPLADEINGAPEQKFELLMNAVRVTHSASILEKALNAAEQIEDKAVKAEALIDVINESMYQSGN